MMMQHELPALMTNQRMGAASVRPPQCALSPTTTLLQPSSAAEKHADTDLLLTRGASSPKRHREPTTAPRPVNTQHVDSDIIGIHAQKQQHLRKRQSPSVPNSPTVTGALSSSPTTHLALPSPGKAPSAAPCLFPSSLPDMPPPMTHLPAIKSGAAMRTAPASPAQEAAATQDTAAPVPGSTGSPPESAQETERKRPCPPVRTWSTLMARSTVQRADSASSPTAREAAEPPSPSQQSVVSPSWVLGQAKSQKRRTASTAGNTSNTNTNLISGYYTNNSDTPALDYRSLDRLPQPLYAALHSHRHRSDSGVAQSTKQQDGEEIDAEQGSHGPAATTTTAASAAAAAAATSRRVRRSSSIIDVDAVLTAMHRPLPARLEESYLSTMPRLPQLTRGAASGTCKV